MMLGICFALAFVSVWTAIFFVANPLHLGKSMACVTSVDQLGFAIGPLIVGVLRRYILIKCSHYKTYFAPQMLFASMGAVSLVISVLMYFEDASEGNLMDGCAV